MSRFPRGFEICDNNAVIPATSRKYRDIDLYKSRPDESADSPDVTDICGVCLRTPRVWVILIPCSHMCCVSCALVFQSMDANLCYSCRTPYTVELPHIQRLPLGYGYAGEECETLYRWYATKSKRRQIETDALSLFRYSDSYTTEKRLVARRYLLDKKQDCYIDSIARDAVLKVQEIQRRKTNKCSLCKNNHPKFRTRCCSLPLCEDCGVIYKRVELFLPARIDRCPICAAYRPMAVTTNCQVIQPLVCGTQNKLVWGT
jgi:hypothetical protein